MRRVLSRRHDVTVKSVNFDTLTKLWCLWARTRCCQCHVLVDENQHARSNTNYRQCSLGLECISDSR